MKIFSALLVCACIGLGGCGQTGPLYLPESRQPAETPAPPVAEQPTAGQPTKQPAEDTNDSQQ